MKLQAGASIIIPFWDFTSKYCVELTPHQCPIGVVCETKSHFNDEHFRNTMFHSIYTGLVYANTPNKKEQAYSYAYPLTKPESTISLFSCY
jgi:hypothetical protein